MKVKIKNLVYLLITLIVVQTFTACKDYLNVEYLVDDQRDVQDVFESMDYSKQWLAGVYSHLRNRDNWDVCTKEQNANQFNFISDDMYYTDREKEGDKVFIFIRNVFVYRLQVIF